MADFHDYLDAFSRHLNLNEFFPSLFEVHADMEQDVFWKIFRLVMERSPVIAPHQELVRRMLTAERVNGPGRLESWTAQDFEWVKRMVNRKTPKGIKVYRGGSQGFGLTGFTWTTKKDLAALYSLKSGILGDHMITVGRINPELILVPAYPTDNLIVFPEHVKIERVEEHRALNSIVTREAQMRITAALKGVEFLTDQTPGQALRERIEKGEKNGDKARAQLHESRAFLEGLGFKSRLATIDQMLEDIDGAVCSTQ